MLFNFNDLFCLRPDYREALLTVLHRKEYSLTFVFESCLNGKRFLVCIMYVLCYFLTRELADNAYFVYV